MNYNSVHGYPPDDPKDGDVFGKWTVLSRVSSMPCGEYAKKKGAFQCRCECGTERIVLAGNLKRGLSTNCGCVRKEGIGAINRSHMAGAARGRGSRAASIWLSMIKRCYTKTSKAYQYYGARGIFICDRWLGDSGFNNFLEDMGEPPTRKHSIGRKENDGPYSPENCRWETSKEQMRNTRRNVYGILSGERLVVADIAEREGVSSTAIRKRMKRGMYQSTEFSP